MNLIKHLVNFTTRYLVTSIVVKFTNCLIIGINNVVILLTYMVAFTINEMHLEKKTCSKTNNKYINHDQAQGFFTLPLLLDYVCSKFYNKCLIHKVDNHAV